MVSAFVLATETIQLYINVYDQLNQLNKNVYVQMVKIISTELSRVFLQQNCLLNLSTKMRLEIGQYQWIRSRVWTLVSVGNFVVKLF